MGRKGVKRSKKRIYMPRKKSIKGGEEKRKIKDERKAE